MTLMPSTRDWTEGDELVWDAWNRLVRVRPAGNSSSSSSSSSGSSSSSSSGSSSSYSSSESSSSSESGSSSSSDSEGHSSSGSYHSASSSSGEPRGEVTYQYDALTRRTRKTNSGGAIDYYYDKQWRAIEEWVGGSVDAHYIWSPLDRWTMIRRKRGSEERYVLKDYLDPAAIIDTGGNVVERFGYDAFGPARFMAPDFSPRLSSAADWNFLFHAEFLDTDTGLYNYGHRYFDPVTGRWPSKDPIGERGGINLYGFVGNDGVNLIDRLGLDVLINAQQRFDAYYVGVHATNGTSDLSFEVDSAYYESRGSEPAEPYRDTNGDPNGGPTDERFSRVDQPSWWPWSPTYHTYAAQAVHDSGNIHSIRLRGKHKGHEFTVLIESEPGTLVLDIVHVEGCVPSIFIDNSIHTRETRWRASSTVNYYTGGEGFKR